MPFGSGHTARIVIGFPHNIFHVVLYLIAAAESKPIKQGKPTALSEHIQQPLSWRLIITWNNGPSASIIRDPHMKSRLVMILACNHKGHLINRWPDQNTTGMQPTAAVGVFHFFFKTKIDGRTCRKQPKAAEVFSFTSMI